MIVDESTLSRPGAGSIAARLVEVLLVHMVRRHLEQGLVDSQSSIGALLHPEIGPALGLIHRHPEQPWTVASLAEQVAMSRSAFSAEFTSVAGKPPMRYLREHRMQLASRLLQDRRRGLKEVAARVGYESIAAFSAAFKRWSGEAPATYRRGAAPD
jgi:AraC-like DNA-binding protein